MGDYVDPGQGRIKGRGHKQRKTRIVKKETYSRKDFRGHPNGNEIYDHVTKLIEEEKVEGGKRESIYCTVYKYLQANARKSFIHERTPDLGQDGMGTKETLAVLLSISTKDVDTILGNAGTELKVDVFAEVGEGECKMLRFPIRYYTTAEDLTNYVLKDMGITESVLNYQLAMVKTPYKGKSKFKAMMCAGGATSPYPGSNKTEKVLYPHEHPLQVLDSKLKVIESKDIPKLQSCYFHVTMRPMESLTVFYRRVDGVVQEDTFTLQPSITCHELIEQCLDVFDLKNDLFAYKLIMKAFEFDERMLARNEQPISLKGMDIEFQEGYPIFLIEECDVDTVSNIGDPAVISERHISERLVAQLQVAQLKESQRDNMQYKAVVVHSEDEPDTTISSFTCTDHVRHNESFADLERQVELEMGAKSNNVKPEKDKSKARRHKLRAQLRTTTDALLESQSNNERLQSRLEEQEEQERLVRVEYRELEQELERRRQGDERRKNVMMMGIKNEESSEVSEVFEMSEGSEKGWKRLYEDLQVKHESGEIMLSGTVERLRKEGERSKVRCEVLDGRCKEAESKAAQWKDRCNKKGLEVANIGSIIEALNLQIKEVEERCGRGACKGGEVASNKREEVEKELRGMTLKVTRSKVKRRELSGELEKCREKIEKLEEDLVKAEVRVSESEKELGYSRLRLEEVEGVCRGGTCSSKGELEEKKFLLRQSEESVVSLSGKIERVKGKKGELVNELERCREELVRAQGELREVEKDNKLIVTERADIARELVKHQRRCEGGECSAGNSDKKGSAIFDFITETQQKLSATTVECENVNQDFVRLDNKYSKAREELGEARGEVERLRREKRMIEEENILLSTQIAEGERLCEEGRCSFAVNVVRTTPDNKPDGLAELGKEFDLLVSDNNEDFDSSLKDERKSLDFDTSMDCGEIRRSPSQISTLSQAIGQLKGEIDKESALFSTPPCTKCEELQRQYDNNKELREELEGERAEKEALQEQLVRRMVVRQGLEEELGEANEKIIRQRDKCRLYKEELISIKDLVSALNAQIYEVCNDKKCNKSGCKEFKERVREQDVKLGVYKDRLLDYEEDIGRLERKVEVGERRVRSQESDIGELQLLLSNQMEKCKELEGALEQAKVAREEAQARAVRELEQSWAMREVAAVKGWEAPVAAPYRSAEKEVAPYRSPVKAQAGPIAKSTAPYRSPYRERVEIGEDGVVSGHNTLRTRKVSNVNLLVNHFDLDKSKSGSSATSTKVFDASVAGTAADYDSPKRADQTSPTKRIVRSLSDKFNSKNGNLHGRNDKYSRDQ